MGMGLRRGFDTRTRLLVAALLTAVSTGAHAQFDYATNNGTIVITGYNGPGGAVAIPARINGLPVTGIGDAAFQNKTDLNNITIPEGVINIGMRAFSGCSWLFGVAMPESVQNIEDYAFYRCFQLVDIVMPEDATNIGAYAFYDCPSLRDVVIPDSVISIRRSAFEKCWRLGSIAIGERVIDIGDWAFSACTALTNATLGSRVKNIGHSAFRSCTNLLSITVPKSVTDLGPGAFDYCSRLRSVYFAGNAPAAYEPFSLSKLIVYFLPGTTGWGATFGDRPTVQWNPWIQTRRSDFGVGPNGFGFTITGNSNLAITVEGCTNFVNPTWFPIGTNTLVDGSAYFNDRTWTSASARIYRLRPASQAHYDYTISNRTITLTHYLGPEGDLEIPGTLNGLVVIGIGHGTFQNRLDLTSVVIPDTITEIASSAFNSCRNLTNVVLGENVTTIGSGAFSGCALTNIAIPASVTNIHDAFGGCRNLTAFTVDAANPVYSSVDGVLFDKAQVTLVRFPNGRGGSYTVRSGITKIASHAFRYSVGMTNLTLSDTVREIGDFAFTDCSDLTNIRMTESIGKIGDWAFSNCRSLTSVVVPNGVTNLGSYTFTSCSSLRNVVIGTNVMSIGRDAFSGCDNLVDVTIPDSARDIGRAAFHYCTGLTRAHIGNSVTNIGEFAFNGCWELEKVTVGRSVQNLGQYAFGFCSALEEILFTGNAPTAPQLVFASAEVTVYYLPGTTGWGPTFSGRPTAVWTP
jgi:hypothetical protein